VPFMGVWAAATNITRNGANPNYVFRVSAVDVLVAACRLGPPVHAGGFFFGRVVNIVPVVTFGWPTKPVSHLRATLHTKFLQLVDTLTLLLVETRALVPNNLRGKKNETS
jgi:hypothetical protein